MQKIGLLLAINVAKSVVVGGYEIDEFGTPSGYSSDKAITLTCGDEVFEFADQFVELDPVEGVVTAVDLNGDEHDISLTSEKPLTHADVRAHMAAKIGQPYPAPLANADFTTALWEPVGARVGEDSYGIIAEFFGANPLGNAARVTACVNACRGVPSDRLAPNVIAALIENEKVMREALATIASGAGSNDASDAEHAAVQAAAAKGALAKLYPTL